MSMCHRAVLRNEWSTQDSTVTVFCKNGTKTGSLGTAWAIELKNGQDEKYPISLITNHHVIEDCIPADGKLTVAELFKKEVPAEIVRRDKNNDLAVLATGLRLKTLQLSEFDPWPGYWDMALGSADGYERNEGEEITHDSSLGQTPSEGSVR